MTDTTDSATQPSTDEPLQAAQQLVHNLWSGQMLRAAVQVGLFERLDEEPTAAATAAADLDLDADATYRLLRALSHYGVLTEDDSRRFSLTPVGALFCADHPQSVRAGLLYFHSPEWISAMGHLPDILREGGPNGFVREFGQGIFDYMQSNPEFGAAFNDFMTEMSQRQSDAVLAVLEDDEFAQVDHVCDIGGGHGELLGRLLQRYHHLEGTVFDRPGVVAEEPTVARDLGVADRCRYVGGDMFESVPSADAYVLKWILHDWDDQQCVDLLSTVHDDSPESARLFVVEAVVPGPETPGFAKQLDITMLVHMGGRERTSAEYETLFERAGWRLADERVPDDSPVRVLEVTKA